MIKVNVLKVNGKINKIVITGHANYDDYGKDIVCSAVSTCMITTVNGISLVNDSYLNVKEDRDKITIDILIDDTTCNKLIQNMLDIFTELENQYPKNIKIMGKED